MVTDSKLAAKGIWLFIDQMLIAIGGWAFWIVIFRLSTPSEIGVATTIYSLVFLFSTIVQLGLEYPLLKKASSITGSQTFGTILVLEALILSVSVPLLTYFINNLFHLSIEEFVWIAVGMLIAYTMGFISRFTLLGLSDVKTVLVIDIIGTVIKFVFAYFLLTAGFAELGILAALLMQGLVVMGISLVMTIRILGLKVGSFREATVILKDGLANSMSKFSRMLVVNIGVVLLASFAVDKSEIGIFYVCSMISIVVSALASSIAYMAIPESTKLKMDLSQASLRLSLSLISPLIVALIVAPKFILSIFGDQYATAENLLLVLSMGILPSAITINTISMFNNLNMNKRITLLGSIQIVTLIISFIFLVPYFGTLGATVSMLISFVLAGILSTIWLGMGSADYISRSAVAIVAGVLSAYTVTITISTLHPLLVITIGVIVNILCMLILKNTSITEFKQVIKTLASK